MSQIETLSDVFVRNPLLRRQVAAMRRTRWQRATLLGTWVLFGTAFALSVIGSTLGLRSSRFGPAGYRDALSMLLPLLAFITAARSLAAGAGVVSREQEQRTWEMLVLTRLTPLQLLAGKMVPAILTVVLPALAWVPCVVLIGLVAGASVAPMLLALLCVVGMAPPWTALAIRLSATASRTTDAIVRAGLVMGLTSPLVLEVLALVQTARHGSWSFGAVVHLAATTLFLAVAATAALLLSTAGVMPGAVRDYPRQARFATGAVYVLGLVLLYLAETDGGRYLDPDRFATMAGVNALAASVGAALACAAAGVPRPRKRLTLHSFHPLSEGPEGALGLWMLLYLAGSTVSTIPWMLADRMPWNYAPPSVWLAILGPACLVAGGSFGCSLARACARWPAAARMALAAVVPLALLVLPQYAAGVPARYSAWHNAPGIFSASFWRYVGSSGIGSTPIAVVDLVSALAASAVETPRQALAVILDLARCIGQPVLPGVALVVAAVLAASCLQRIARHAAGSGARPPGSEQEMPP